MNVNMKEEAGKLTVAVEGRLDTTTAPDLEKQVMGKLEGVTELVFDFGSLEYISSAGLRILLSCQKKMNAQGKMVVKNLNDTIHEIFEVTGFIDILTIE